MGDTRSRQIVIRCHWPAVVLEYKVSLSELTTAYRIVKRNVTRYFHTLLKTYPCCRYYEIRTSRMRARTTQICIQFLSTKSKMETGRNNRLDTVGIQLASWNCYERQKFTMLSLLSNYTADISRCDFRVSWEYFHVQCTVYIVSLCFRTLFIPRPFSLPIRLEDSIFEHKNQLCPDMPEGIVRIQLPMYSLSSYIFETIPLHEHFS